MDLRRAAVSLREAAERELGVRAKIKTGRSGDMTILVDGKAVFNYKEEGRMPALSDLLRRLAALRAGGTA
ncbi:MAG TPA: hypothetical protein VFL42_12570 [Terriglobales bacterium]|nr:hypothetical protein [Terriglobales bacterium]